MSFCGFIEQSNVNFACFCCANDPVALFLLYWNFHIFRVALLVVLSDVAVEELLKNG